MRRLRALQEKLSSLFINLEDVPDVNAAMISGSAKPV